MNAVMALARKEIKDGLRNRWLVALTLIFALLSSGLAWFGGAAAGSVGFSTIANTILSLATLSVFLIPLIALLMAYGAFVGEDEDGTLLLLLTYPLTKAQLLIGKLLGHGAILAISILLGFGSSVVVIALLVDGIDIVNLIASFSLFILSATLLGTVFVAIAYWISAWVSEKSKAAGLCLIIWFLFVIAYDMGLLAILVSTKGQLHPELFPYLLLFNPTDAFRLINLIGFNSAGNGVLLIAKQEQFSIVTLFSSLMLWVIVPLLGSYWSLMRRSI